MPKALCILGMVIAALLVLLFGADLVFRVPFRGLSTVTDIVFIVFSAILGYLSWATYAEQV